MRILFVNAYFKPETIAFSHLEKDLIEGLVSAGHEIEVICPTPTRSVSNEIYERYKKIKTENLYNGMVHVRRFSAPREGKNPLIRAIRYVWCNFREYQIGKKYKNIDVVFAVSTPPTQGLLAGKLSKKLNASFIYSLQDIFPDSLVSTGLSHEGSFIWKIGTWIEKKTYGYAKQIIVISESCKKNLLKKGVPEDKLTMISNWVDIEQIKPIPREENRLISELGIDSNKFLIVYAGNFGAAQGADIILKAAEKLKDESDIQFVIFGGGAEFKSAVQYVEDNNLINVLINPLLSQDRVSEVYSLGDVALITCKTGVGNSGMPSKMWSIMACNTHIIASFDLDSDLANILKESGAGIVIEPEDSKRLAKEILNVYKNKSIFNSSKINSRDYVNDNASKNACTDKYLKIIKETIEGKSIKQDK